MVTELLSSDAEFVVGVHNLPYCSFDFCAILLNILVLVNYLIGKKINNRTSKLFYMLSVAR